MAKQLGREANHSLLPSSDIKNAWNYTPHNPHNFIAKLLVHGRLDVYVAIGQHMTISFDYRSYIQLDVAEEKLEYVH